METEQEIMRHAMAIARSRRNPEKLAQHAVSIAEKRKGLPLSEEHKSRLREAQQARRERELAERVASGIVETTGEKKPVGRPRKQADPQGEATPKRGRGRPKKQTGETLPMEVDGA